MRSTLSTGDIMALSNRIAQAIGKQYEIVKQKNNIGEVTACEEEHALTQVIAVEVKEYFGHK